MPSLNTEHFKLAIELAAPSLARATLLLSSSSQRDAVSVIVNAYNAVHAAQEAIKGPRQ
jgi:hypothetical protein